MLKSTPFCFADAYASENPSPRLRGIGFANSAKRRSVLAQDLADEFSAKRISSQTPSRSLYSKSVKALFFLTDLLRDNRTHAVNQLTFDEKYGIINSPINKNS